MPKKKNDHLHLYIKKDLSRNPGVKPFLVFACVKPGCTHWMRLDLALGKLCECNRCGEPMILDKETITLTKPHCQNCIKRKPKQELDALAELVKKL